MNKKPLLAITLIFFMMCSITSYAQTPNGFVGIGTITPKAKLHIVNDSSGLLIPKYATLALANSQSLPKLNATDHKGLMIYVDEVANQGFWYYNGTAYVKAGGASPFFKVSSTNTNHIIYNDAANYGKNFIVNADSTNWKTGTENKMFFNPSKGAFRAGRITNTNWDNANIGTSSFAAGENTKASGANSTALGYNTAATGVYSTAMGGDTKSSAPYSTAMGYNTTASGSNSTATGNSSTASGLSSLAAGENNTASGDYSFAMGRINTASNANATAIGIGNTASGYASIAMGNGNKASDNYAFSVGLSNQATKPSAIAMGESSIASVDNAIAIGFNNQALGYATTAMGYQTKAKSVYEMTTGYWNDTLTAASTSIVFDSSRVFSVGTGTSNTARATSLVVQQNGFVGAGQPKTGKNIAFSSLQSNGSFGTAIRTYTATSTTPNVILDNFDGTILILGTIATTVYLPDASKSKGRIIYVKKRGTVTISMQTLSGSLFDTGATALVLPAATVFTNGAAFQSDGTDWNVISKF